MRTNNLINELTTTEEQIEFLYNAAAKQLYNLAFYSTGDQAIAEQMTIDVFNRAFCSIHDKTDVGTFLKESIRLLYRHCRKAHMKAGYVIGFAEESVQAADPPIDPKTQQLLRMFGLLSFDERFLLLLFCWQRYPLEQIASIMRLPIFTAKKRFNGAINHASHHLTSIRNR